MLAARSMGSRMKMYRQQNHHEKKKIQKQLTHKSKNIMVIGQFYQMTSMTIVW
ncbi:unnamed protein product [Gongylonema pulchrum]|uniref:Uncharacterized protein n=1 Tax=Gongylonema pulchrum TaxID=637853 RepID=A0A3P7P8N2_9BILA|nr:unnamed protein product [Gongylonema pulchrum]